MHAALTRALESCALLAAVAVILGQMTGGCILDPCGNDKLQRFPSPDGALEAVTFRRNCGATTAYSTQVSVVVAGSRLPNDGGNVFVMARDSPVFVQWREERTLAICYPASAKTFRMAEKLKVTWRKHVEVLFEKNNDVRWPSNNCFKSTAGGA